MTTHARLARPILRDDFQFKKISTTYATHGMHPYVASMIPALAKKMIQETKPVSLLDPFCGGGGVCVEGVLAGIPTAGLDINILSLYEVTYPYQSGTNWHVGL